MTSASDAKEPGGSELGKRVVSALLLGVVAIATAWIGGITFLLVWSAAAFWVWWEWTGITEAESRLLLVSIGVVALAGAALALALDAPAIAMIAVVIGAGVAAAMTQTARAWVAGGVFYAAAALVPVVMLRNDPQLGLVAILLLFAVVWASDIAAYFSGRLIGGPRLAVRVSPNKTWAGSAGGLIAGVLAGLAVLYAAGIAWHPLHVAILIVLVIAEQIGDLVESAVKRRFRVKDASSLIPGHGGLMDRIDGFIAAALVALVIGIAAGGASAPATGLLVW